MDGFSKFHFKDIEQNEKIIRVIHRNWFYLLQQYVIVFLVMVLFGTGIIFFPVYLGDLFAFVNSSVVSFAENFFILAIWMYCFMIWIDYYFDIWIITSERIINVEQKGMFTRKASELRYAKIQDVTTEVMGFLPSVFNYGDVRVQTAGEVNEFVFRTISDPYRVKNLIMELQKQTENHSVKNQIK